MSLKFLSGAVSTDQAKPPIARSAIESAAFADGAHFEIRDGWNVAVSYGPGPEREADAAARTAGWADVSHLGKLELQAPAQTLTEVAQACGGDLKFGEAIHAADARWCRLTETRALAICERPALAQLRERLTERAADSERAGVVDVSASFGAITIAGPRAREIFARFCALDLRPASTPVGALRPGSIARQPGILICEAENRYLFMFGWATGEYVWSVVSDAGGHLGGQPIGLDALHALSGPARSASVEAVRA